MSRPDHGSCPSRTSRLAGPFEADTLVARQTGTFVPKPGNFPEKGDDTIAGGIFCISLNDLAKYIQKTGNNPAATGAESPNVTGAVATDGPASSSGSGQTEVQDQRDSLDWAFNGGASKYGTINLENVTTAGHSCGGLQVMSTAYHDERVRRIMMFDIAIFQDDRRYKVPVSWFVGRPKDMGFPNAEKDYSLLNAELPAFKAPWRHIQRNERW
ncbi:hypothetical protein LQW54_009271 [Pestalotiopsis sp. IQ-011]